MISIAKYREFLDLAPDNDEDISDLKNEIESLWEEETQSLWTAETDRVEIHRVLGSRITTIFPNLRNISSVSKVEVKSEDSSDWTELKIADKGWGLFNDQIIRYSGAWKPLVRLTYSGGYATDACPSSVKRALKIQAKFSRERMDTEVKVSSQSFQGGAGSFSPPDVHLYFQRMVDHYRRFV
tara:strand:- start:1538 stop:2083 length:546 start_codon:yes stop_codon:yes gene_type:complete